VNPKKMPNLVLIDPKSQTLKVIKSVRNDAGLCCWKRASACYWKDSKIIFFGGYDELNQDPYSSAVAIITLQDLDSESTLPQYLFLKNV